jgi:alpha-glucosidase
MVWDATEANAGFSLGNVAPWLPVKAAQAENAVAGQLGDPASVLEFYRAMLRLRRDTPELRTGRTRFFDVEDPVLAFTRGQAVLCVFNLSPETHRVGLTGAGAVALAQGAEHGRDGTLTLHPNGFAIMEAEGEVAVTGAETRASSPVP